MNIRKIKVLIACDIDTYDNPYLRTLVEGMNNFGEIEVFCSIRDFFENWRLYDIIHIQWPQVLLEAGFSLGDLIKTLDLVRSARIPVVCTCHNLGPHRKSSDEIAQSYDEVYKRTDVFIHLGPYSLEVFSRKYPSAIQCLLSHHVYDLIYSSLPVREEALAHLKLDSSKKYILSFGGFRNNQEREMAYIAVKNLGEPYRLLAPNFIRLAPKTSFKNKIKRILKKVYYKIKYPLLVFTGDYIQDSELPYFYAACELAFIQRKKILNSGNLYMGLLMHKVVVGPDKGNVGPILESMANPTFDPENIFSVTDSLKRGLKLAGNGLGEKNYTYAIHHCSTMVIAKKHIDVYKKILYDNDTTN